MYNFRLRGIVQPVCHLALFLHPKYRHVFVVAGSYRKCVQEPACELLKKLRLASPTNIKALIAELAMYKEGEAPYDQAFVNGLPLTVWWQQVTGTTCMLLVKIARLLAAICPHAADVERLFSIMGNYNTPRRAALLTYRLQMMSKLKVFYGSSPSKVKKASADVDPDQVPSLPLPENRPEVLFVDAEGSADVNDDADESVQSALQAFCDDGIAEMKEAETEAMLGVGNTSEEIVACQFSRTSLEINQTFPLDEPACLASFAPTLAPTHAPAQPDEVYDGPEIDIASFLNDMPSE